jgi:hypothetical protein
MVDGLPRTYLGHTQAKSHRSQLKGYNMPLVDLQNFLNDLVTDSPHLGRARPAPTPSNSQGGGQPTGKRPNDDSMLEASKRWQRGEGLRFGRGHGRGG